MVQHNRADHPLADAWRALHALARPYIYHEFKQLWTRKKFTPRGIVRVFLSAIKVERSVATLEHFLRSSDRPIDVMYCYWNFPYSFAAAMAKRAGNIRHLVARVHGGDLYESRFAIHYSPFKRQFANDFDRLYFLAANGRDYYQAQYNAHQVDARIAPLGVQLPELARVEAKAPAQTLRLLSIANVIGLKRLDKMLASIALLAERFPEWRIEWSHIGSGELLEALQAEAEKRFGACSQVQVSWLGQLSNQQVCAILAKQNVTCLVNTSESEGMPVSIMEAMAYGIPVVAPDVGAIAELLPKGTGMLLDAAPSPADIAEAIAKVVDANATGVMSAAARAHVATHFDAEKNYQKMVRELTQLAQND
ncbi:glycosyltransferase [Pseudidiomarina sediminum]|uniref:glycosyltransferase n=1 Tax=Pseudidiomarina sediminum TaxID=431675 RepID=UPI001C97FA90|nr:glycosyltransferase [Pseudidiomarina sediminum]